MKEWKIGDVLITECPACGEEENWIIEDITKKKYNNGLFGAFEVRAIKHCILEGSIRTSIKDVEKAKQFYKLKP